MAVLGLLLMLGAAAVATDAVIQNTQLIDAVLFNHHFSATLGASFVTGCVVGLLFALGLAMFLGGFSRSIRARRERRALRRNTAETEALRERNAALENHFAAQDNAYPNDPATTTDTVDDNAGRHRV
jgi:predicted phage tail protein